MIKPDDRFKPVKEEKQFKDDLDDLKSMVGNPENIKALRRSIHDYLRRNADICPKPTGVEGMARIYKPRPLLGIPPLTVFLYIKNGVVYISRMRIEEKRD